MSEPPKQVEEEAVVFEFEEVDLADLDERERQILADMDAGQFISNEAVMRWLMSWGTDKPLPPPKCGD